MLAKYVGSNLESQDTTLYNNPWFSKSMSPYQPHSELDSFKLGETQAFQFFNTSPADIVEIEAEEIIIPILYEVALNKASRIKS